MTAATVAIIRKAIVDGCRPRQSGQRLENELLTLCISYTNSKPVRTKPMLELVTLNQLVALSGVARARILREIGQGRLEPFASIVAKNPRPTFLRTELPEIIAALNTRPAHRLI